MGRDRMIANEAIRIAQAEDEHLSIGCDVERGDGYTVLTSSVCPDMWDANHVRQIDLVCDTDVDAFIGRMETLFREMNREHCKFELDFRTQPQQLAAVLRRRGYVCTRGVVQVYRGTATRVVAARRTASGATDAGCSSSRVMEMSAQSGQSTVANWAALERESYSAYDSGTGFSDRAVRFSLHRLECAWKSGLDYRVFLALADGGQELASEQGSGADRGAGVAVGTCELFRRRGVAKIESLYVTPAARGSGVGAALLNRALGSAIAAGDDLIYLVAAAEDWPRHMYPRFGFVDLMETSSWMKMLEQDAHQTGFLVW
ncbi:MAG: GNAT family N-acetyltransferase [Bacillota bacterium]|jgi:GNAT superfamily N-acetyltransferase